MIGARIKQARTAAGLSLRELGDRAGVSAMAISKYERGENTPSSGVLLRLAKAVGVRTEYFFRPVAAELKAVEYRKHARLPKKLLERIRGDVIEQVERMLELERFLPALPVEPFAVPPDVPKRVDDGAAVEESAAAVRAAWDLGSNPIPDLIDTLEEHGIRVFQTSVPNENRFDGLAAAVDGTPIIVVDRGWPGDRQRFTLAHELAHLVLKDRLLPDVAEEAAANRFAGAFLVPAGEARRLLGERRTWLEPRELWLLKMEWGLSMGGWLHRAQDLGILSAGHYREMVKYFRARRWHITEPFDALPREKPKLFDQLVYRALAEGLVAESKAAELLGQSLIKFHDSRDVDDGGNAAHQ